MTYTATITQKGQVTIPIAIRTFFGLEASSKLIFSIDKGLCIFIDTSKSYLHIDKSLFILSI